MNMSDRETLIVFPINAKSIFSVVTFPPKQSYPFILRLVDKSILSKNAVFFVKNPRTHPCMSKLMGDEEPIIINLGLICSSILKNLGNTYLLPLQITNYPEHKIPF
jgi:hypothetical protein